MAATKGKLRVRATDSVGSNARQQQQRQDVNRRRNGGVKPKNKRFFLLWASVMVLFAIFLVVQSSWANRTAERGNERGVNAPSKHQQVASNMKTRSFVGEKQLSTSAPKLVTAYLEPPETLQGESQPLALRTTHQPLLDRKEFPTVKSCETLTQDFGRAIVNSFGDFGRADPFLPWLHDFFVSADKSRVVFLGQNRRNCFTGKDTTSRETMDLWAPQIALFQPVPLARTDHHQSGTSSFRIAGGEEYPSSTRDGESETFIPETRFLCRFHLTSQDDTTEASSSITHSQFPFNYEYVSWRKSAKSKAMIKADDTKQSEFWISQLIFHCPIPPAFQAALETTTSDVPQLLVDVIPIRTPPRFKFWLTPQMVGPQLYQQHEASENSFDATQAYGSDHVLPKIADSGRWANLPVCPIRNNNLPNKASPKPYRMVLCTWTSASYRRRGEDEEGQPLDDTTLRLREWLLFHRLVGFDHVVVYDNTQGLDDYKKSPLYQVLQEFSDDFVTHQPWPAIICNNHRPGHANPGDRSSQYAAEASCRERYGPLTDWMAFIDTDEYLTPMKTTKAHKPVSTWEPILQDMEGRDVAILKFRSARSYPRVHMMDPLEDQTSCGNPFTERFHEGMQAEQCLTRRATETFLKTYNCDSVKLPRPDRFQRAMKQLYRPDYVLSHFVHYSTVTEFNARYYDPKSSMRSPHHPKFDPDKEVFVDERNEGVLIHARSVVPRETMFRSTICQVNYRRTACLLGYECPDSVEWMDDMGREKGARTKKYMNPHHDEEGNFCSCWVNQHVENVWVPRLEQELSQHMESFKL